MIIEENFNKLKTELSSAIIAFEKGANSYHLYFNNHSEFQEFKQSLNHLYYEFIKEVRQNLNCFKTNDEIHIYLEMLLHVFEILDEQNGAYPDFVAPHRNVKMVSKINTNLTCIYTNTEELSKLISYFQYQKRIIHKSVKFIQVFHAKCINSMMCEDSITWSEELKDIYPEIMKLKGEMSQIKSIAKKIDFLQNKRSSLALEFEKKEKSIYSSPINFFFEVILDCLKDLLVLETNFYKKNNIDKEDENLRMIVIKTINTLEQITSCSSIEEVKGLSVGEIQRLKYFLNGNFLSDAMDGKFVPLKWTESKTAMVELIYALYSSKSIDNGRCGIKEIAELFEKMFDIQLGDIYHTFLEVRNRKIDRTKFLDTLKGTLLDKMIEADEK